MNQNISHLFQAIDKMKQKFVAFSQMDFSARFFLRVWLRLWFFGGCRTSETEKRPPCSFHSPIRLPLMAFTIAQSNYSGKTPMTAVTQSESTVLPLFIQSAKLNTGAPYNELRADFRKHTRLRFFIRTAKYQSRWEWLSTRLMRFKLRMALRLVGGPLDYWHSMCTNTHRVCYYNK